MKKSLIALAVAGVFVAPVAMADTTVYGQANVSIDVVNNGFVKDSQSTNHVSSNVSRLGFKGSEDLGGGMTAGFQIEQEITLDSGNNLLATRNTFATLGSDSMGTVVLGKHDTPYKLAARSLDVFGDTVADNRSIMGGIFDNQAGRLGNVVAYISPAFSGLTVIAATVTGAETAVSGDTKGGAISLAALYGAGPLTASLAYETADVGSADSGDLGGLLGKTANSKAKATRLGVSYTMDALQVNAAYEKHSSSGGDAAALGLNPIGAALDRNSFYLAGKYSLGSDAVKLAYTSAGKQGSGPSSDNTEGTQFSVGYDHPLSKRTTVYALYSKISNKSAASYTFSQATSKSGAPAGADADPSVISVGMKHSF